MAIIADGGVEADDPELAEVGLLIATMGEGVFTRAHKRFVCIALFGRAESAKALRSREDILATLLCLHTSFNSCHTKMITKN